MPRRPDAHKIGDIARNAVEGIFTKVGWATEVVQQDYGEDLLIQPVFRQRIEHFRIWVQIKGSQRKGPPNVTVPAETALRWVRSADPVLIAHWNTVDGIGRAVWARNAVTDWNQFVRPVRLNFDAGHPLDEKSAILLGRELAHYQRLLAVDRAEDEFARTLEEVPDTEGRPNSQRAKFADEVLEEVGILHGPDLCQIQQTTFEKVVKYVATSERTNEDEALDEGCALALLAAVHERWGVGIPSEVLSACVERLAFAVCLERLVRDGRVRRSATGRFRVVRADVQKPR